MSKFTEYRDRGQGTKRSSFVNRRNVLFVINYPFFPWPGLLVTYNIKTKALQTTIINSKLSKQKTYCSL